MVVQIAAFDGLAPPVALDGVDSLARRSALHADLIRREFLGQQNLLDKFHLLNNMDAAKGHDPIQNHKALEVFSDDALVRSKEHNEAIIL